jgi:hypothetical protein
MVRQVAHLLPNINNRAKASDQQNQNKAIFTPKATLHL